MYISCLKLLIVFFFFKQNTAYEMRISDLSSDVCSSDLRLRPAVGAGDVRPADRELVAAIRGPRHRRDPGGRASAAGPGAPGVDAALRRALPRRPGPGAGRSGVPAVWP